MIYQKDNGDGESLSFSLSKQYIQATYIFETAQWVISNKSRDRENVKAVNAYGIHRINGYEIIKESLNLKDMRIFD